MALSHHGQFDPGGKLIQTNGQDEYIKEQLKETFIPIGRDIGNS